MNNIQGANVVYLISILLSGSVFGQSPEEIYKKSLSLEKVPQYQADFEQELASYAAIPKTKTHGIVYGTIKADGSVRQRREIVSGNVQFKIIVEDGKMYQILPGQKSVIETPATTDLDQMGTAVLSDEKNFSIEMRSEEAEGKKYFVLLLIFSEPVLKMLENTGKETAKLMNLKVPIPIITCQERWIDADSFIVCKIYNYDAGKHIVNSIQYKNINTNVTLSDSLFEIPANLNKISVTNSNQLVKEVVKQTIADIVNQKGQFSNASPSKVAVMSTKGRYIILGIVALQVMGILAWVARKYSKQ